MRNFFSNLGYRFQQWMQGRYGNDEFNRFLSIAAFVLIVGYFFGFLWSPLRWLYIPTVLILAFSIFRTFSRNIEARTRERNWYLRIRNKVSGFFRIQKRKIREGDKYRFFTCPDCRTTIRVPKGHGRIEITCPRCRKKFIKRT